MRAVFGLPITGISPMPWQPGIFPVGLNPCWAVPLCISPRRTGSAQGYLEEAARLGLDAYLTGEVSEQTVHVAREYGIHFFACGHHATERYGAEALGRHLSDRFNLEFSFIDIENPV